MCKQWRVDWKRMQVLLSVNPILTPWNSKYIVKQFPKRSIIAFPFPNSYSSLGLDFILSVILHENQIRDVMINMQQRPLKHTSTQVSCYTTPESGSLRPFPYTWEVRKAAKPWSKNYSFNSALSTPVVSTSAFHSTNLFLFSTNSVAPFSAYKPIHKPIIPQIAMTKGLRSKNQLLNSSWWPIYVFNAVAFAKSPCNYDRVHICSAIPKNTLIQPWL